MSAPTDEAVVQDKREPYPGEFYRCVVGSTLAGMSLGGGDRDEMGMCIEGPETVVGLGHFEQHRYRTQPEGQTSGPGDLDLTVYSLRKWMRLAVKGNPTILDLLFVPPQFRLIEQLITDDLLALRPAILSRRSGTAYLGYLTAQRQRLVGERGGRRVQRPLNEEGYDGKYAAHMVRLCVQGVELLTTGHIELPIAEPKRSYLLSIRRGEVSLDEVLTRTGELERELADLTDTSPLQEHPDMDQINKFLEFAHLWTWKSREASEAARLR